VSYAGAYAAIAAEMANVSWVVPASAASIPLLGNKTTFDPGSIFTYEFAKEMKPKDFPVARIFVPGLEEARTTSGSDLVAQKLQTLNPQVYVWLSVEQRYPQGGQDLFNAILDAVLAYFRQHSGGGETPALANNDLVTSVGLRQRSTADNVNVEEGYLNFRGMVSPAVQMSIV
jgi:hypothetical protein